MPRTRLRSGTAGLRVRAMVPADVATPLEHEQVPWGTERCGGDGCASHHGLDPLLHDPQAAWARAAMTQWGLCGVAVLDGDAVLAQALLCSGLHLPGAHPLEMWSKLPQAAYLLALQVAAGRDGEAMTRLLVQQMVRHLEGQVATVEAVGRRDGASCLEPPLDWLCGAGFRELAEPSLGPGSRVRLELGQGVHWRPDLNRAWQLLAGLVPRPLPPAEPTGRTGRCGPTRRSVGTPDEAHGPRG